MSAGAIWEFAAGPEAHGITHAGKLAVRAAIDSIFTNLPDVSYETLRTYQAGDTAICEVLAQSPSKNLRYQIVDIMTFDEGDKIAIKRTYRKVVTPK
jgi:hypothetical protein